MSDNGQETPATLTTTALHTHTRLQARPFNGGVAEIEMHALARMKNIASLIGVLSLGLCYASAAAETPTAKSNRDYVNQMMVQIAGHEDEPAGKVFRNIHIPWLKNTPAGTFLSIMEGEYSAALGVGCLHCHVGGDFSKDDKRPKRAAREMAAMHYEINQQLAKMKNLEPKPEDRFINCATCHRGSVDPHSIEQ